MDISLYYFPFYFFIFVIGASIASFFQLVVDRYQIKETIIYKPSYCPHCKQKLFWWHNIPVLSYLILRGKCFFCSRKINPEHLFYELFIGSLTLIMFATAIKNQISPFHIAVFMYFIFVMLLLMLFDLRYRVIPHAITYSSIILITISMIFIKGSFYVPMLNIGAGFLTLDLLVFFVALIKRISVEENYLPVALLLWGLIFFFIKSVYILSFVIIAYLLFLKFKSISKKYLFFVWLSFFVILTLQIFKHIFLDFNFDNLIFFFVGIGIVYFVCEVVFYLFNLLFKKLPEEESGVNLDVVFGGGDITVFALISVFLGYKNALIVLFLASIMAIISYFSVKVLKRVVFKQAENEISHYVPFVPYLVLACFIILMIFNDW